MAAMGVPVGIVSPRSLIRKWPPYGSLPGDVAALEASSSRLQEMTSVVKSVNNREILNMVMV